MLLLQNLDIINSLQMLHYMCDVCSTPSCGLRMNGDTAHHQHQHLQHRSPQIRNIMMKAGDAKLSLE